uniref:Uncharacterized protein n=1 Tax=Arundo donax TaxID=35708 RepID=A0A0A9I0P7_ARUDO
MEVGVRGAAAAVRARHGVHGLRAGRGRAGRGAARVEADAARRRGCPRELERLRRVAVPVDGRVVQCRGAGHGAEPAVRRPARRRSGRPVRRGRHARAAGAHRHQPVGLDPAAAR